MGMLRTLGEGVVCVVHVVVTARNHTREIQRCESIPHGSKLDVQEQGAGWCNFLRPFCGLQVTASHCVLSVFAWSASMCMGALFASLLYEN